MLKPPVDIFSDRFKTVLLLCIIFTIYVSCFFLSVPCSLAITCLEKPLCVGFVAFPYYVPGQVWYLIVWISDLCLPLYIEIEGSLVRDSLETMWWVLQKYTTIRPTCIRSLFKQWFCIKLYTFWKEYIAL